MLGPQPGCSSLQATLLLLACTDSAELDHITGSSIQAAQTASMQPILCTTETITTSAVAQWSFHHNPREVCCRVFRKLRTHSWGLQESSC